MKKVIAVLMLAGFANVALARTQLPECSLELKNLKSPFESSIAQKSFAEIEPIVKEEDTGNGPRLIHNVQNLQTEDQISYQISGCSEFNATLVYSDLESSVVDLSNVQLASYVKTLLAQTAYGLTDAPDTEVIVQLNAALESALSSSDIAKGKSDSISFLCGDGNTCWIERSKGLNSGTQVLVHFSQI